MKTYHKYIKFSSVDDDKKTYERIIQDMLEFISGRLINFEVVETWSENDG